MCIPPASQNPTTDSHTQTYILYMYFSRWCSSLCLANQVWVESSTTSIKRACMIASHGKDVWLVTYCMLCASLLVLRGTSMSMMSSCRWELCWTMVTNPFSVSEHTEDMGERGALILSSTSSLMGECFNVNGIIPLVLCRLKLGIITTLCPSTMLLPESDE